MVTIQPDSNFNGKGARKKHYIMGLKDYRDVLAKIQKMTDKWIVFQQKAGTFAIDCELTLAQCQEAVSK